MLVFIYIAIVYGEQKDKNPDYRGYCEIITTGNRNVCQRENSDLLKWFTQFQANFSEINSNIFRLPAFTCSNLPLWECSHSLYSEELEKPYRRLPNREEQMLYPNRMNWMACLVKLTHRAPNFWQKKWVLSRQYFQNCFYLYFPSLFINFGQAI